MSTSSAPSRPVAEPESQLESQSESKPQSQANIEPLTDKDIGDLRAVWSVLIDRMKTNPAMAALLQSITLVKLDGPKAHIAPVAGQESVAGYVQTEHRKKSLAQGLEQIVGRPVQVVFEEQAAVASDTDEAGDSGSSASTKQPSSNRSTLDLDSARRLPLVNEVLNVFPDAMIIGMYEEHVTPPAQADANPSDGEDNEAAEEEPDAQADDSDPKK